MCSGNIFSLSYPQPLAFCNKEATKLQVAWRGHITKSKQREVTDLSRKLNKKLFRVTTSLYGYYNQYSSGSQRHKYAGIWIPLKLDFPVMGFSLPRRICTISSIEILVCRVFPQWTSTHHSGTGLVKQLTLPNCTVLVVVDVTGLGNVKFNTRIPSVKGYSDSSAVLQMVVSSYKNLARLDTPQLFLKIKFVAEPSPLAACTDTT